MKSYINSVVEKTLCKAEKIYNREFTRIPVLFNLKGMVAGQFVFSGADEFLKFNIPIAETNGKDAFKNTVVHEVAHYIARCLFTKYIKPHGYEWKKIMMDLDTVASVTHNYAMPSSVIGTRHEYKCECQSHFVSTIIHNKIRKGSVRVCRKCKTQLSKC